MDLNKHPGLNLLKEAFKKFADKYGNTELGNKVTRSVAAGAQATVNHGLKEFPKSYIKDAVNDFIGVLTSQEVADGISQSVRAFDEEKVKEKLDQLLAKLQEPEVSLKVATQIKRLLDKNSTESIEQNLDQVLATRSDGEQMIVKALFEQFKPMLDTMRDSSVDEVAEQVRDLAATVPTDAIAMQAAALTREITPERVSEQAQALAAKLPNGKQVSDIVHGLGTLASEKLGDLSKSTNVAADAKTAITEFVTEAQNVVKAKLANDNTNTTPKRRPGSDGKSFSL